MSAGRPVSACRAAVSPWGGWRQHARAGALLLLAWGVACGDGDASPQGPPEEEGAGDDTGRGGSGNRDAGGAESTLEGGAGGADLSGGGDAGATGSGAGAGTSGGGTVDGCTSQDWDPENAPLATGIELRQISVLQAVDVPIMEHAIEITDRNASIVAGRPALLRGYVVPASNWEAHAVRARLTIVNGDGPTAVAQTFDRTLSISAASSDGALASTFNFEVPGDAITENTLYSVELFEGEPCRAVEGDTSAARFPETDLLPLQAVIVPKLRILLVPVSFENEDMEVLSPDTSPEQIDGLRHELLRLFPIPDVELSVREAVSTTATSMVDVLDQIAALRDQENVEPDLSYYGLVRFTETLDEYCSPSCVLGASFNGEIPGGGVGVGIGFTGDKAALTFAHEMGHVNGRAHTPCGVSGDPDYPYSGGRIGSYGYDIFEKVLVDPFEYKDFMGYCSPTWVSDYVYDHLEQFISAIPVTAPSIVETGVSAMSARRRFRTLLLEHDARPRWGVTRELRGAPPGAPEIATVYDAAGRSLTSTEVYRLKAEDSGVEVVYVAEPPTQAWAGVKVRGQPVPHPFGEKSSVRELHLR